jgi:arylsulfatase A-like enzyme
MKDQNRRDILKKAIVSSFSSLSSEKSLASLRKSLPNIVFILADDLGYADIGVYGHTKYKTQNIDRLAHEGLLLTQAYSNSPVCSATRVALMTGNYQYRLHAGLEEPIAPGEKLIGLPANGQTLPLLLKNHGYKTALIGKWHLGYLPNFSPLKSGYDEFFGNYGGAIDYFSHSGFSAENDGLFHDTTPVKEEGYYTEIIAKHAVEYIKKRNIHTPFLLSIHFTAPHWPWEGPKDHHISKKLKSLFHYDGGSIETYARMIESLDFWVGHILQTIEQKNFTENTIVIFTSDNGGERFSNNWPFSGQKTELLEGGIRVPAIIRWPRKIPVNKISSQVSITMDWLPTILAAVSDSDLDFTMFDGTNLIDVFKGNKTTFHRNLFWRYKANAQRAHRYKDFKYLKIKENEFLFDVKNDKRERADLAKIFPDIFKKLQMEWIEWNSKMLPITDDIHTHWINPVNQADHYSPDK